LSEVSGGKPTFPTGEPCQWSKNAIGFVCDRSGGKPTFPTCDPFKSRTVQARLLDSENERLRCERVDSCLRLT